MQLGEQSLSLSQFPLQRKRLLKSRAKGIFDMYYVVSYLESPLLIGAQSDPPFGVPCPVSDYP
jgi:hypothetical protein